MKMETKKINIFGELYPAAKVSKYMQTLADKHGLVVEAFIDPDYNRKVYKFTGGPLAAYEALEREVKGYESDGSRNDGFSGARYLISSR